MTKAAEQLAAEERAKYEATWNIGDYRKHSPGLQVLGDVFEKLKPRVGQSIIDFGCGTGRVCDVFAKSGLEAVGVDIAENAVDDNAGWDFVLGCIWDIKLPDTADFIFSADVLEHIPTEMVDETLANMAIHMDVGGYLQIAHFPDSGWNTGVLHLTVEQPDWWLDKIKKYFIVEDYYMIEGGAPRTSWIVRPKGN